MLLRCCLLNITIIMLRHVLYLVYVYPCFGLVLSMSYLCKLFFILSLIFIIIMQSETLVFSTFNTNREKRIIFKQQKFSLRLLLSLCLIFRQFQPGVAYKSVAYKKVCVPIFIYKTILKINEPIFFPRLPPILKSSSILQ